MSLEKQIVSIARKAGGSFKTVSDRETIVRKFALRLRGELNIQIKTVDQIKVVHIEKFIASRLEEGIDKRTLQNEMSAIRRVLEESGRDQLLAQPRMTNKALGLAGATRAGTKNAITPEHFQAVLHEATARSKGMSACLLLSRWLGLRAEESVQACQSLPTWSKHLAQGKDAIRIVFGTKGSRPRNLTILPERRAAIIEAVRYASVVAKNQSGHLIDKPNLKKAMDHFNNEARALGLIGKNSPHSLRYLFAREQFQEYELAGYSRKEALASVALDLGHCDGRGRYVERVYLK